MMRKCLPMNNREEETYHVVEFAGWGRITLSYPGEKRRDVNGITYNFRH